MEATISEIAPDVFRISVYPPGAPVSFGCFLIRDDQPAMVETGLRGVYGLVHDATDRLLFTSDLFMQPGDREPITDADRSAEIVDFCRFSGLLPSQKHL